MASVSTHNTATTERGPCMFSVLRSVLSLVRKKRAAPRSERKRTKRSSPADREIAWPQALEAVLELDPGRLCEFNPNSRLGLCLRQARICKEG